GDVAGKPGETRVSLSLYETTDGAQVWHRVYVYDSTGVLPIEQAASMEVAARVAGALSAGERQRLRRVPTAHHAAYEWALRGDAETDDPTRASDAYRNALKADPGFADGYARLALVDATLLETGGVSREN